MFLPHLQEVKETVEILEFGEPREFFSESVF